MLDISRVWQRVDKVEPTGAREVAQLLKDLLEELRETGGEPAEGFLDIARVVASAMHRVDHREDGAEVLCAELQSGSRHPAELNGFLTRLIAPDPADRFPNATAALESLPQVMDVLQAADAPPAGAPLPPPELQSAPAPGVPTVGRRKLALAGFVAIPAVLVLLFVNKIVSENRQARSPTASESIQGTGVEYLSVEQEGGRYRMTAEWADEGRSASSNGARLEYALSWPDVYRDSAITDSGAWFARRDDEGTEWVELLWNIPVASQRIVLGEGGATGAVVAVDEIRDVRANTLGAKTYVRLWEGKLEPAAGARFTVFRLAEPRSLAGLRLVLDTASVPGRNRIDGIGLVGAEPGE